MTVSKTRRSVLSSCRARSLAPTPRPSLLGASSGAGRLPRPASPRSGRPTPPPGCVCKQGSVSRGCWRGVGDWQAWGGGGGGGRQGTTERAEGPAGSRGGVGVPFSLPAPATALTQGSSRLSGLGHCHHQKDVQMPPFCTVANKFLCDFFSRPALALLGMNQPAPRAERPVPPCTRPPAPFVRPHCPATSWPGLPGAGQGRRGARPAWPSPRGRPSGAGPPSVPWRSFCVARSHLPPPRTHTPPGHFSPSRPGLSSLPQANGAQLFALGGGLANASN